ncbi:MerR family transcriptional regulator [Streptomyces sp. G5(2025)]|uniref:MerR family transcriptional regulator n=1 Tax=Streptomyces sp. G5(2025) TaxID=3406628 RepID=UPI003C177EF0
MRLSELSERSDVSTATIKYYLREGLLPPGERVNATVADYGEGHLHRLRLVRALLQVGGIPVARARQVLATMDDSAADLDKRLDTVVQALPCPSGDADEVGGARARRVAADLLEQVGWAAGTQRGEECRAYQMLVGAIAALDWLGYPYDAQQLAPYARRAAELADHDVKVLQCLGPHMSTAEAAVTLAVLLEPLMVALRRLAIVAPRQRRTV